MDIRYFIEQNGLYLITDSKLSRKTVISDVESAIKAGVKIIQYREKELPMRKMFEEATKLRNMTRRNNVLLIINDRIDLSMAVEADGVHLGQDDMPYESARKLLGDDKIIGLTAHNVPEAMEAEKLGADYIGVSPIFSTTTKKDAGEPAGVRLIREIKDKIHIPFTVIGGINYQNLDSVMEAGARSVIAISAILTKDDVEEECRKFIDKIRKYLC
jgi:thiamine-phosphate pyrophosphorylase